VHGRSAATRRCCGGQQAHVQLMSNAKLDALIEELK
jgi:hypothetical protein